MAGNHVIEENKTERAFESRAWKRVILFCKVSEVLFIEKPKCGCSPLDSQYSREKRWVEKKGCFI